MRLVVADTGPLNYLVLIGQIELLSVLFERVFIPRAVQDELRHSEAPPTVRDWIARPPSWIEIVPARGDVRDPDLDNLDDGERAAIALAISIGAELLLMDDRDGVATARRMGFAVTGTLGILDLAARRDLIDLKQVVERLRSTSFRCRPEVLEALLAQYSRE